MAKKKKKNARKRTAPARKAGDFYPPIKPYNTGFLRVSPVHEIYYEESGNPQGQARGVPARRARAAAPIPRCAASSIRSVIASCCSISAAAARAGRRASLVDNTTWHLVADIEALREHLQIDTLAGVRRLVGLDARAGLRAETSGALHRARVARHLPAAALRSSSGSTRTPGRGGAVPRSVGALPQAAVDGGAQGLHAVLLQATHQRRSRDAARGRARLVHLGKRARRT